MKQCRQKIIIVLLRSSTFLNEFSYVLICIHKELSTAQDIVVSRGEGRLDIRGGRSRGRVREIVLVRECVSLGSRIRNVFSLKMR